MHDRRLLPLGAMAQRVRVAAKWLRQEAESGRIPHLTAGSRLLFDSETVERILLERAREPVGAEGKAPP